MIKNLHNDAEDNKVVDIIKAYNHTTFDFIGDFAFAESFQSLETRTDHPFMVMIFQAVRIATVVQTLIAGFPFLRSATRFLREVAQSFDFGAFVHDKVSRRIDDGDRERPDLMAGILKHNNEDGEGITTKEVEATATVLIGAGSETTATLLSGCTGLLLQNPAVMSKLQGQLRSTFESADDITVTGLNKIPYIMAVLEESMRLYPPVPVMLPRKTPPEGTAICGHFIPGNVSA
jgi:cytochrome P450